MKKAIYFAITGLLLVASCVPARKVEELKSKYATCDTERTSLAAKAKDLETENTELKANVEQMTKAINLLAKDTALSGHTLRKLTTQYDKIDKLNDELLRKQIALQEGSAAENKALIDELRTLQDDLQKKEDELKVLEKQLDAKEKELAAKRENLNQMSLDLADRESRVKELEAMIAQKDAAVNKLKEELTTALLSYKDKGLTVEERDGRIYVSMEAKLLFGKGKTDVDPAGKSALIELAKVLETQKDISISVEGHTDSDKLSGKGRIKDNWELSVLRATSVVKLMLANSAIDPLHIVPAGRGALMPIDPADTKEAKAKNRRIEVILTPDLNKLFKILNGGE